MNKKQILSLVLAISMFILVIACGIFPGKEIADQLSPTLENLAKGTLPADVVASAQPLLETAMPELQTALPEITTGESEFPLPDDAKNITNVAGTTNFQTKLTIEEAVEFYRQTFTEQGLTEREITTTIDESVFSIVFDGAEGGKSIVIQGVKLGETTNINIRYEDV